MSLDALSTAGDKTGLNYCVISQLTAAFCFHLVKFTPRTITIIIKKSFKNEK